MRYERVETVEKLCNLRVKGVKSGQMSQNSKPSKLIIFNGIGYLTSTSKAVS